MSVILDKRSELLVGSHEERLDLQPVTNQKELLMVVYFCFNLRCVGVVLHRILECVDGVDSVVQKIQHRLNSVDIKSREVDRLNAVVIGL